MPFQILLSGVRILCLCCCFAFTVKAQSADEAAIKALIEAETLDYTRMSFADLVRKYWILDDKTMVNVSMGDCVTFQQRASDMIQDTSVPEEDHAKVQKDNYVILVNGNAASAYHHQLVTITENGQKINSHELRILEKVNGEWKIHMSVSQYYP